MARPIRPPHPPRFDPPPSAAAEQRWVAPEEDARWQQVDQPVTADMWGASAMFSLLQDERGERR